MAISAWGRSEKERDPTCSVCTRWLQREPITKQKDGVGRRRNSYTSFQNLDSRRYMRINKSHPARTGKAKDLLRWSFLVYGTGGVMWYPGQQVTALNLRGPLQVPPAHNVQLANKMMCLMLLELSRGASEIPAWLVHGFHLCICVRH